MRQLNSRRAKTFIAYSTGNSTELRCWAHLGTKQAAMERAIDLAMRSPQAYNDLLDLIANRSEKPGAPGMLRQYAIAWKTNIIEARLDLSRVGSGCDPREEDPWWAKHAVNDLNEKRAKSFRMRALRLLGSKAAGTLHYIDVLSYFNRAEHFGSQSYVLAQSRAKTQLRCAHVLVLIVKDEITPGYLSGLEEFRREHLPNGYVVKLTYQEALRMDLRQPAYNNYIAKIMPLSPETVATINEILPLPLQEDD